MCSVQSKYTQNNNSVIKKINQIENDVKLFLPSSKEDVDHFKIKYLGKSGVLNKLFEKRRQEDHTILLRRIRSRNRNNRRIYQRYLRRFTRNIDQLEFD